jgi:hypothetical protein
MQNASWHSPFDRSPHSKSTAFLLFMNICSVGASYLLACQHSVPSFIVACGALVVFLWRFSAPIVASLLFLLAAGYVALAIWRQGQRNLAKDKTEDA